MEWIAKLFRNFKRSSKGIQERQHVTLFVENGMIFRYGKKDKIAQNLDIPTSELKQILTLWIRFIETDMNAFQ